MELTWAIANTLCSSLTTSHAQLVSNASLQVYFNYKKVAVTAVGGGSNPQPSLAASGEDAVAADDHEEWPAPLNEENEESAPPAAPQAITYSESW